MALLPDAFTIKLLRRQLSLITDIGVSSTFDEFHQKQGTAPFKTKALWDTGASHCFITASLAKQLDLTPISKTEVAHAKGKSSENVYALNLHITPKYYVEVEVTECQSAEIGFDIIIGMEVISQSDFALTSKKGIMTFSFRLPSSAQIDFKIDQ